MHDVARLLRVEIDRLARVDGMTRAQWSLLLRLEENPGLSQKEIADVLEVEPISVARLVDRTEENGLVERRPDKDDRRVWRLHLTPLAAPTLEKIKRQLTVTTDMVGEGITPAVHETMIRALLRMKMNLLKTTDASLMEEIV